MTLKGQVELAKKIAATRPHPLSPNAGLLHEVLGPGVSLVDRLRDGLTGRSAWSSARVATRPGQHLRLARPSRDLAAAERFWVQGLGLQVLWRVEDGHRLLMLGWPGAGWHLELVEDPAVLPQPTEEDLLVLYAGETVDPGVLARLRAAGGREVPSRNPYWDEWGTTVEDPDGYRLVLSHRSWAS